MITYTHSVAGNLPIKTLVAKQRPTNMNISTLYTHIYVRALNQHMEIPAQYAWGIEYLHL